MMLQWWMLILSMAKIPNNGNLRSEQFSFKLLMLTLMLFSIVMWHILKVLKWISWCWCYTTCAIHRLQFEGQSCLSHKHFPSLSSGWAMKVQLISDSAVHTSRTKARLLSVERDRQQFSNRQRTDKNLPQAWRTPRLIIDLLTDSREGE